jgi:membrane fusion protein (multidrug efflux system)
MNGFRCPGALSTVASSVGLFWLIAAFSSAALAQSNAPVPVILERAQAETMVDRVEALGTLRANESVTVTSKVTEIVSQIHFTDGQRVKAGDVLAEMTSSAERAQLEEAEATEREAREQLERIEPLVRSGATTPATLAERRRDYETARARTQAARARLSDRVIMAPFDGVTGLRRISVGALVEPGTVITTIEDDSVMKLDFTVPSMFMTAVRSGAPVEAMAAEMGDRIFRGTVTAIDNRIDPDTRSITIRAEIPNPEGLLTAGLLMTVEILNNERSTVVVPEQAIVARASQFFVYVVDPDQPEPVAEQREVTLGARRVGEVEIVSGLSAGEAIITHGTLRVRDGQRVSITAIARKGQSLIESLAGKGEQPET